MILVEVTLKYHEHILPSSYSSFDPSWTSIATAATRRGEWTAHLQRWWHDPESTRAPAERSKQDRCRATQIEVRSVASKILHEYQTRACCPAANLTASEIQARKTQRNRPALHQLGLVLTWSLVGTLLEKHPPPAPPAWFFLATKNCCEYSSCLFHTTSMLFGNSRRLQRERELGPRTTATAAPHSPTRVRPTARPNLLSDHFSSTIEKYHNQHDANDGKNPSRKTCHPMHLFLENKWTQREDTYTGGDRARTILSAV